MLNERCEVLNETGHALNEHFDGQIVNLIEEAKGSANTSLDLIWRAFPSFRDSATLDERETFFLKRALIVLSDL